MAWQLVYTSAPRLLDAGRSGFGTVARHRDIPQLLLMEVERVSQFARLPGMDQERVVFSHRHVVLGSARYHVLSMVRSSGSDYSGRTNHIAQHLLATDREARACAEAGVTPADVMLGHAWLTAWEDQPMWLDSSHEVALAELPHASHEASSWAALTGKAANAWLLVTDPAAARRSWLRAPAGTDFRDLFLESLRGQQGTSWQPTWTTELEPTDDPSGLNWIGSATSLPAVGSSAASGRVVLDLTRPETLPQPQEPKIVIPPPSAVAATTAAPEKAVRSARVAAQVGGFVEHVETKQSKKAKHADDPFGERKSRALPPKDIRRRDGGNACMEGADAGRSDERVQKRRFKTALIKVILGVLCLALAIAGALKEYSNLQIKWKGEDIQTANQKQIGRIEKLLGGSGSHASNYYSSMVAPLVLRHDILPNSTYTYSKTLYDAIGSGNIEKLQDSGFPSADLKIEGLPEAAPLILLMRQVRDPVLDLSHKMDIVPENLEGLKPVREIYAGLNLPRAQSADPLIMKGTQDLVKALEVKLTSKLKAVASGIRNQVISQMPVHIDLIISDFAELAKLNGEWSNDGNVKDIHAWLELYQQVAKIENIQEVDRLNQSKLPGWLQNELNLRKQKLTAQPPRLAQNALPPSPAEKIHAPIKAVELPDAIYVFKSPPSGQQIPDIGSGIKYTLWLRNSKGSIAGTPSPGESNVIQFWKELNSSKCELKIDGGKLKDGGDSNPLRLLIGSNAESHPIVGVYFYDEVWFVQHSPLIVDPVPALDPTTHTFSSQFIKDVLPKLYRGNLRIAVDLPQQFFAELKAIWQSVVNLEVPRTDPSYIRLWEWMKASNDDQMLLINENGSLRVSEVFLCVQRMPTDIEKRQQSVEGNLKASRSTIRRQDDPHLAATAKSELKAPQGGESTQIQQTVQNLQALKKQIRQFSTKYEALLKGDYPADGRQTHPLMVQNPDSSDPSLPRWLYLASLVDDNSSKAPSPGTPLHTFR